MSPRALKEYWNGIDRDDFNSAELKVAGWYKTGTVDTSKRMHDDRYFCHYIACAARSWQCAVTLLPWRAMAAVPIQKVQIT